jgi:nickel-dependent lactate racemase
VIVRLDYGTEGLDLVLDETRLEPTVLHPKNEPALADPKDAFLRAVREPVGAPPLSELGRGVKNVVIAIADHTRPVPDDVLVPWIVGELGVDDARVTILVGTGTHRASTSAELAHKLGADVVSRFRVVNHDATSGTDLVEMGRARSGGRCFLNRLWVEADVRIATGFIEPHFFAGFSGGAKAIVPGIAGLETIQHFHRAELIAHPGTTWGRLDGNPLQALTREMTAMRPPHFIVNVTLNLDKKITAVFAGDVTRAHNAGCERARREALTPVHRTFPVVVTTGSGHPLDQNFYQTVKGISAAARIVEPGGTIVVASRCANGIPDEGLFRTMLADPRGSDELFAAILESRETQHDQWQVQILLDCLRRARVVLYSGLSERDRRCTRTEHTDDIGRTLAELARGRDKLPVAVLPSGPLTIPEVRDAAAVC